MRRAQTAYERSMNEAFDRRDRAEKRLKAKAKANDILAALVEDGAVQMHRQSHKAGKFVSQLTGHQGGDVLTYGFGDSPAESLADLKVNLKAFRKGAWSG